MLFVTGRCANETAYKHKYDAFQLLLTFRIKRQIICIKICNVMSFTNAEPFFLTQNIQDII